MTHPTRRDVLTGLSGMGLSLAGLAPVSAWADASDLIDQLHALEARVGGRLGVAAIDLASGANWTHRGDERFAFCSTFKFLAAAYVLARVDLGQESLARRVVYQTSDLVEYSPLTETHAGAGGLDMAAICEAAVTLSDNTAGNLMFASFGGPAGLTQFVRSLGDDVTRFDRIETQLNEATPGDPRDTTNPAAMLSVMRQLLIGSALSPASRAQLIAWLTACKTGETRLRAGFPATWVVGDKTGTGGFGSTNDIAIAWPPGRPPVLIAAYYTEASGKQETRDSALAEVARLVVRQIGG